MREKENSPESSLLRSGFVALLGWTNVGKSTLLNRLVGAKLAAVSDAAQTTRNTITGVRSLPGRGQAVFVDTPGLHKPRHKMNRNMVERSRQTLGGVDLAVLVVDADRGVGAGDRQAAAMLSRAEPTRLMVLNKVDLVRPKTKLLPLIEQGVEELGFPEVIPVSARTGEGCPELLEHLISLLPEAPPPFPEDYLTDQPERALAAEWIREQLLAATRQELPHATAVVIERWHERDDGLLEIDATVLVDRTSQKKIVIGRGGELLKRVGTAARLELERLLERRVGLRIWVKVCEDWRNNDRILQQLGLG